MNFVHRPKLMKVAEAFKVEDQGDGKPSQKEGNEKLPMEGTSVKNVEEDLSSWVTVNVIPRPDHRRTSEALDNESKHDISSPQEEDGMARQKEGAKPPVDDPSVERSEERLPSWVKVDLIYPPNSVNSPEASNTNKDCPSQQEEDGRAPQEKDDQSLLSDRPVEEPGERVSSWLGVDLINQDQSAKSPEASTMEDLDEDAPSQNEYSTAARQQQEKEPSKEDSSFHQQEQQQEQTEPPRERTPPKIPPGLARYISEATPLTQEDLDIYALIGNARERPLPEVEAGLIDTEASAPETIATKLHQLRKLLARKNKKSAAQQPKPKRSNFKQYRYEQRPMSEKEISYSKEARDVSHQYLKRQEDKWKAGSSKAYAARDRPRQQPRGRTGTKFQAKAAQVKAAKRGFNEQSRPETHKPRASKRRSLGGRRERELKASPFKMETLRDERKMLGDEGKMLGGEQDHSRPLPIGACWAQYLLPIAGSDPPLSLSTLSLQQRDDLSKIHRRISSLPELKYKKSSFIVRKPARDDRLFYFGADISATEYGFVEPKAKGNRFLKSEWQEDSNLLTQDKRGWYINIRRAVGMTSMRR